MSPSTGDQGAARRPRLARALVALTGGALLALATPPFDWLAGVPLALALLHAALARASGPREAALLGLAFMTLAGALGLRFVPATVERFTPLGLWGGVLALLLLALYQGTGWAAGAALGSWLSRRWRSPVFVLPATLVGAFLGPAVFAWTPVGLLAPWTLLLQSADVLGERGVSMLLALAAAGFGSVLGVVLLERRLPRWREARWAAAGVALLGAMTAHGAWSVARVRDQARPLPSLRVGVVQAAVEARLRWDPAARTVILGRLRELSRRAEREGAELVIWPEAAYPFVLPHGAPTSPRDARRSLPGPGVRGPVLLGLLTELPGGNGQHNAALVARSDGTLTAPQAKLELLAFGERLPLGDGLPWLRRVFYRAGGLRPGEGPVLQEVGGTRVAVLNCYEDTLPGVGRVLAAAGPGLLVNLTNDAWFAGTFEPELHLRLSALRAVETRRDLVRAVNLGVPAWIDATGTVRARGDAEAPSVFHAAPVLRDGAPSTPYVRWGDATWSWALVLAALFAERRRARAAP